MAHRPFQQRTSGAELCPTMWRFGGSIGIASSHAIDPCKEWATRIRAAQVRKEDRASGTPRVGMSLGRSQNGHRGDAQRCYHGIALPPLVKVRTSVLA